MGLSTGRKISRNFRKVYEYQDVRKINYPLFYVNKMKIKRGLERKHCTNPGCSE